MKQTGYYEIVTHSPAGSGAQLHMIVGNVRYNSMHWHNSLEVICCVHGALTVRCDSRIHPLAAGDLLVINGGEHHEITDGLPDGLQFVLSVDPALLKLRPNTRYSFWTSGEGAIPVDDPDCRVVRRALARIACLFAHASPDGDLEAVDELLRDPETWYSLHISLYRILLILSRHTVTDAKQQPNRQFDRFQECIAYIHEHFREDLSIGRLANWIGFSEPTLYRLFQAHLGVTFNQYLNMLRINAALSLLAADDVSLPVTQIAEACGYASLSNFYRAFRQLVGVSPGAYKKGSAPGGTRALRFQDNLLTLNQFQPFQELPYTLQDLEALAQKDGSPSVLDM